MTIHVIFTVCLTVPTRAHHHDFFFWKQSVYGMLQDMVQRRPTGRPLSGATPIASTISRFPVRPLLRTLSHSHTFFLSHLSPPLPMVTLVVAYASPIDTAEKFMSLPSGLHRALVMPYCGIPCRQNLPYDASAPLTALNLHTQGQMAD